MRRLAARDAWKVTREARRERNAIRPHAARSLREVRALGDRPVEHLADRRLDLARGMGGIGVGCRTLRPKSLASRRTAARSPSISPTESPRARCNAIWLKRRPFPHRRFLYGMHRSPVLRVSTTILLGRSIVRALIPGDWMLVVMVLAATSRSAIVVVRIVVTITITTITSVEISIICVVSIVIPVIRGGAGNASARQGEQRYCSSCWQFR